jgi:predicted ester cyclase
VRAALPRDSVRHRWGSDRAGRKAGRVEDDTHLGNKRRLHRDLARLAEAGPGEVGAALAALYEPGASWRGAHPLNERQGLAAIGAEVWAPLLAAFPDLERRDLIVAGGAFEGRDFVATLGHYAGTFANAWLGIPATGRLAFLRYGEVHAVEGGRIIESTCLWDVLDLMRQAGTWPLGPSLGVEGMWPGPINGDGLLLAPQDAEEGRASLAQTLAMHGTLGAYDDREKLGREGLIAMPQREHWHPRMMWYGPAGIGSTRGLAGFVDHHQLPFRLAFPNRKGGGQWDEIAEARARLGGGHFVRIGDGPYSVTGGWPSIYAVHGGGGFLGLPPTGRTVTMRVMDFYLHHEGLIRENWVPLDVAHLLLQMGVDVFERMHSLLPPDRRG